MDLDRITELRREVRKKGEKAESAKRELLRLAGLNSSPVKYEYEVHERLGRREYRGIASLFDNARLIKP